MKYEELEPYALKVFCWYDKAEQRYLTNLTVSDSERSVARGFLHYFDDNNQLKYLPQYSGRATMDIRQYELCILGTVDRETGELVPLDKPHAVDVYQVLTPIANTNGKIVPE